MIIPGGTMAAQDWVSLSLFFGDTEGEVPALNGAALSNETQADVEGKTNCLMWKSRAMECVQTVLPHLGQKQFLCLQNVTPGVSLPFH